MLKAVQAGSSRDAPLFGAFLSQLPPGIHQHAHLSREASRPSRKCFIVAVRNPKGFGPPPAPSKSSTSKIEQQQELSKTRKGPQRISDDKTGGADDDDDEVPQIVMDRMLKRIGVSLGIPLLLAVLTFPLFYYLKIVLKWDVPEWLPLLVSGTLFGSSALGITYGIVSTSWDPVRDGSLLGWKEAKANWPIFFDNVRGKGGNR